MGAAKHEISRQESCRNAAIKIHRQAGNITDSLNFEPCDNDNNEMTHAYAIAGKLWNDNDPLIKCFNDRKELMDAIDACLKNLPFTSDVDAQIFEKF